MTHSLRVACCAGVLLLASCGGGGGGDSGPPAPSVSGGGFAPSSGPGDADSYYPTAAGDQWQYNYTTNDPNALADSAVVTLLVTGTKPVQGVTATVITRADPTLGRSFETYFQVTGGGVTNLGNSDANDTLTPLLVPYVQQLFPVTPNSSVSTLTAKNLAVNDGAGHTGTLDLTQTIANAGIETVDVPAGTFTNALKQTTTINGTVTANGQNTPITGTESSWYVPGVGQIKDTNQAGGGGNTTTTSAELRFYVLGGKPHGLSLPRLLNGPNGPLPTQPEPVITSDGTTFLIVMLEAVAGSSPTQQRFTGTLFDPNANCCTSFPISPAAPPGPSNGRSLQAAAASDGTHYLVVYETDHSATGDPTTVDSVVLSASGALIAGPTTVGTLGEELYPSGNPGAEALAFDGSRYLLAYVSGVGMLIGEYLDPATGQVDGASFPLLATLTYGVDSPALAFDGTNYLLAFGSSSNTSSPGVRAERVSTTGVVLDATPLVVVQQNIPGGPGPCCNFALPALSFDGANYLVSWWDYDNPTNTGGVGVRATVRSARVSKSLALLDATAIAVTTTAVVPVWGRISAAYLQGAHWVTWTQGNTIQASRVSPAGTVPAAYPNGFVVNDDPNGSQYPVIAAGSGGGYFSWVDASGSNPRLMGLQLY